MSDNHQIPFYRLLPNDVIKVMQKTPYESYFRLLGASKAVRELVHRCDRFRLVLPHAVKLVIEESIKREPIMIWEDHDWRPDLDSPVRFQGPLDHGFSEFLKCLRFHHISIQANVIGRIFKSCEKLENFFTGSRIRCTTLSLLEIENKETCWKLYKMMKPSRMIIRCANTNAHELFKEHKFELTFLQLYTSLANAMIIMPEVIGVTPSIRIAYVARSLDHHILLVHILDTLKMAMQVPPKSCWHLRLSYSCMSRGFVQLAAPTLEQVAQTFGGYNFNYTKSGEDNFSFEGIAKINRGEYLAEIKISKNTTSNDELFQRCTFAFELQHSMNFDDANMQDTMIRTNNDAI